ncbi:hypothetical protein MJO29_013940 [Puccinia striiformis f. sp. tritici]|nr:hypothetical protein MJO29_013940 [Puccinia striiformis f. sp. tritici]
MKRRLDREDSGADLAVNKVSHGIMREIGTRDLLQKFNPSHKPTVLSVKPLLCAAALRSYFLALEFFSSWELLSKQNPQTSQPKILIVGLMCQTIRAQSPYQYMRVFPHERSTLVENSESVPDLESGEIKRKTFQTQQLYSALGSDIKQALEQNAWRNSRSPVHYLVADAATVTQGTYWTLADRIGIPMAIDAGLSAKINDGIGKMLP